MKWQRMLVVLVFFVGGLAAMSCPAADWTQFRGPGGQGVSSETGLPTTWSDSENVAWKTRLPGFGASSPIALGDRLFVTCHSGYGTDEDSQQLENLTLHVVCVDRGEGKILWEQKIPAKQPEEAKVRDHGYAAPTPATDGEHLYVFFGKTGVLKFTLDGEKLWQADVGSKTNGWGCGTSPVLFENLVIVNASVESGSLVALDKADGHEVWRAGNIRSAWNTPHLVKLPDGKQELAISVKGSILGFDPATGEELWRCDGIEDYVCPSVVSHDGVVYAIGGRQSQAIAVKAGGRGNVTATHRLWTASAGANVSSPVVHDGHLYWVSERKGAAYCLRLSDGEVIYSERVDVNPYASTLFADGKLYVVSRRGDAIVLAAKPEFELLAHNKLSDRSTFNASPIVSGGKLFLRSDHFLYCLGK